MRDGEKKKEKGVCSSKIVRYDVTGAPRTEEQKRDENQKQPREMVVATCLDGKEARYMLLLDGPHSTMARAKKGKTGQVVCTVCVVLAFQSAEDHALCLMQGIGGG